MGKVGTAPLASYQWRRWEMTALVTVDSLSPSHLPISKDNLKGIDSQPGRHIQINANDAFSIY